MQTSQIREVRTWVLILRFYCFPLFQYSLESCQSTTIAVSSWSLTKQVIKPREEKEGRNVASKYMILQQPQWPEQLLVRFWQMTWNSSFVPGRIKAKSSAAGNRRGQGHRLAERPRLSQDIRNKGNTLIFTEDFLTGGCLPSILYTQSL